MSRRSQVQMSEEEVLAFLDDERVVTCSSLRNARQQGRTRAHVYGRLRDAIVETELEPGRRLSENELADWLGVSRTPIREALIRLVDDRPVEIVPQLGTFVSRVSEEAVQDAQFIREALECAAVRLAAEKAGRDDVKALKAIVARQDEVRVARDHARWYVLDDEFHAALCELSGHGVAWSLVQRANGHLNRVRRLSLPQPRYLDEMVAEHKLVVGAVSRGEPGAAEEAMRHHLRVVVSTLPAIRDDHPEYFERGHPRMTSPGAMSPMRDTPRLPHRATSPTARGAQPNSATSSSRPSCVARPARPGGASARTDLKLGVAL